MTSPFAALNTGLSGLEASQMMIQVASNNVANANTPGYSREVGVLHDTMPFPGNGQDAAGLPGQVGTGVNVVTIQRTRDQFLDYQIRGQLAAQGQADTENNQLSQVQSAFNEPSNTALSNALSTYWAAWNTVANNPTDSSSRATLVTDAQSVATEFNRVNTALKQHQSDLDNQVQLTVSSVNDDARQIAALNQQIVQVQSNGLQPNSLLDQRDQLLDTISSLAKVTSSQAADGAMTVYLGGQPLVDGSGANALTAVPQPGQPFSTVKWANSSEPVTLDGGKLGALVDLRDNTLPSVMDNLSATASRLIQATNSIHVSGVGLDGQGGRPFFTGTDAGSIAVNAALVQDPSKVAAARQYVDPTSGATTWASGDGSNALALADLQQSAAQLSSAAALQPGASLGGATVLGVDVSGAGPNTNFSLSASGSSVTIASNGQSATFDLSPLATPGAVQVLNASALGVSITLSAPSGSGASPSSVASALAGSSLATSSQTSSIDDQYAGQIGQLGVQVRAASNTSTNQGVLVNSLTQQRQSISGVSIDEEATNLLQYQHAYQAAARVISTIDAMLDTLINNMS